MPDPPEPPERPETFAPSFPRRLRLADVHLEYPTRFRVLTIRDLLSPDAISEALASSAGEQQLDLALQQLPVPGKDSRDREKGKGPDRPKAGKTADVIGALLKTPEGRQALENLSRDLVDPLHRGWRDLPRGTRNALRASAYISGAAFGAFIAADPDRREILGAVSGQKLPIFGTNASVEYKALGQDQHQVTVFLEGRF